jgi:hypothetical protein
MIWRGGCVVLRVAQKALCLAQQFEEAVDANAVVGVLLRVRREP